MEYPLTEDLLSLQILLGKIANKTLEVTDTSQLRNYLKMYVAIRKLEMSLDPSSGKLVRNMANAQETYEGTARYIETVALKEYFQLKNSSFSFDLSGITTEESLDKKKEIAS